jgi:hypothetical protein
MLDLSRVTLLFVETRAHDITKLVIEDCLRKANFGDVLIYTDDAPRIGISGPRYVTVPDFPNKKEAGKFYYQHAAAGIPQHTDFALMLEWDGGIFNPEKWRPEFFNYDYVGAPWNVRPGDRLDVGNGGFTLMSRRLAIFMAANASFFPVTTDWDFCRVQREPLEARGFKWPDRKLAADFSWELGARSPNHFGFHGAFNWPALLERDDLIERARLLTTTPYLRTKMPDLIKKAPWLLDEIGAEARNRLYPVTTATTRGQQIAFMTAQRRALYASMQARGLKA